MSLNKSSAPEDKPYLDPLKNLKTSALVVCAILATYLASIFNDNAKIKVDDLTDEQAQALAKKIVFSDTSQPVAIDLPSTAWAPEHHDKFRQLVQEYYKQKCPGCPPITRLEINGQERKMKITFGNASNTPKGRR